MSSISSISDVIKIIVSPIERDREADFGFRRTIEIRNSHGVEHTVVLTSDDRGHLEIVVPIH